MISSYDLTLFLHTFLTQILATPGAPPPVQCGHWPQSGSWHLTHWPHDTYLPVVSAGALATSSDLFIFFGDNLRSGIAGAETVIFLFNKLALYKEFFSLFSVFISVFTSGFLIVLLLCDETIFLFKSGLLFARFFTIPWWIPMWSIKLWILLKLLLQILHFLGLELNFSNNWVLKWTNDKWLLRPVTFAWHILHTTTGAPDDEGPAPFKAGLLVDHSARKCGE